MFNRIFDLNLLKNHVCIEREGSPFVRPPPQTPSTLRRFAEYRETGKCMRDIRWQFSGEFWRDELIDFKIKYGKKSYFFLLPFLRIIVILVFI